MPEDPPILIPEDGSGLPNSNSFASVADADAYHVGRLHDSTWTEATNETKEIALIMATTILGAKTRWQGIRASADQALYWPREGAVLDGYTIAGDEVPRPVKNATSELARLLIAEDLTADVDQNDLDGLDLGKGALKINFRSGSRKAPIPTIVEELLEGLGNMSGAGNSINIRRVTR